MKLKTKISKYFFAFALISFNVAFAEIKETSTIKADKLETNPEQKSITATGNVELLKGDKIFNADKITYRQTDKIIEAEGSVKVNDEKGNNLFADKTILTDDALQGDFYDAGIIFENGSSITSRHITRESADMFLLRKPRYFICPTNLNFDLTYDEILERTLNKKRTLFSIKSSSIKVNQKKNELTFKHALLKVWGVPVFYLPYLQTNHPFKEKQTGFEAPELRHSSHYRYGLFLPYYIKLNESSNMTLKPGIYQENNKLLEIEYNKSFKEKGFLTTKGSIIDDMGASKDIKNDNGVNELDEGKYKKTRGHGEIKLSYQFNDLWSTYGNGIAVSDDYLLRDYYHNYEDYLKSNVDFDRINQNNYNLLKLQTLFFQEIKEEKTGAIEQTPKYVPIIDSHIEKDALVRKNLKISYNLDSNYTSLVRTSGLNYNRITLKPSIENKSIVAGNVFKTSLGIRGDGYYLEENYKQPDSNTYDKEEFRKVGSFDTEWKLPLVKQMHDFKWLLEPKIKYMFDTAQDDFERNIPNEDSQSPELSYSNLFSNNRYGGYDRIEHGSRISYGLGNEIYNQKYGSLGVFVGQGYRNENDNDSNFQIRGFNENISDIVGVVTYTTDNIFDINYRFRLDRTNYTGKSNELTSNFQFDKFRIFTTYTMLKAENPNETRQEQITYGGDIYFIRKWTLSASFTTDLVKKDRIIEKLASLNYEGSCTSFRIEAKEYHPRDVEKADRSFRFNFKIKTDLF